VIMCVKQGANNLHLALLLQVVLEKMSLMIKQVVFVGLVVHTSAVDCLERCLTQLTDSHFTNCLDF